MDDRPAPSPAKLRDQFADWVSGDELPGRTMAYLKTGFLPEVLAEQETTDAIGAMLDAWSGWEKGDVGPATVLETLQEKGLDALLVGLASP